MKHVKGWAKILGLLAYCWLLFLGLWAIFSDTPKPQPKRINRDTALRIILTGDNK